MFKKIVKLKLNIEKQPFLKIETFKNNSFNDFFIKFIHEPDEDRLQVKGEELMDRSDSVSYVRTKRINCWASRDSSDGGHGKETFSRAAWRMFRVI